MKIIMPISDIVRAGDIVLTPMEACYYIGSVLESNYVVPVSYPGGVYRQVHIPTVRMDILLSPIISTLLMWSTAGYVIHLYPYDQISIMLSAGDVYEFQKNAVQLYTV